MRNSIFRPEDSYTLKVEGAKDDRLPGDYHRRCRDPRFIERLDEIIEGSRNAPGRISTGRAESIN